MIRVLARDTLIYGLAAILSRGLSLIALPIYTRILSPMEFGALDMVSVAGSLALLIVSFEITQGLARYYSDAGTGPAEKRRFATTALWFTVACYVAAAGVALALAEPLSAWLLDEAGLAGSLRIGIAYMAANGIFYLAQNQLRFALRSGAYAVASLVYSVGSVGVGVGLALGFHMGLDGILWGLFIGAAAAACLGLWTLRESYSLDWSRTALHKMLAFSLPLVPSALATFLTLYGNRVLLNEMEGLGAVALFGVAVRIAGVIGLLIIGLQSALTPLIYTHHREPQTPHQLARLAEMFAAFALIGCLALGLLAWEIVGLMAESRYAGAAPLVLWLAPATFLSQAYIFFPGIAIAKRTKLQLCIFLVTATATLLFNWALIELFGLAGAGVATLGSSLVFMSLWVAVSQRLYPLPIRWGRIAAALILFVAAMAGGLALQTSGLADLPLLAAKIGIIICFAGGTILCGLYLPLIARAERLLDRVRLRRPRSPHAGPFKQR